MSHDVGDNHLTFQSLHALNLLGTGVRYNYRVDNEMKQRTEEGGSTRFAPIGQCQ